MTTWWARRRAPGAGGERGQGVPWAGCVGESGDEFPGAESLQGAEGFPRRSVVQSWHATNFGFSLQAPSYTLDFDRPSRFLKLRDWLGHQPPLSRLASSHVISSCAYPKRLKWDRPMIFVCFTDYFPSWRIALSHLPHFRACN
jgi:hypothetical protein